MPRWPNAFTMTSTRPAARAIPKTLTSRSAGVIQSPMRCCGAAVCWKHPRRPEVKSVWRRIQGLLLLVAVITLGPSSVQAHPHVWITASSQLLYAPDGSIAGVRHAWTFDDMFSTYALQGIETKTKGVYSREQLAPLAQVNVENLREFGFSTFAKADGKKEKFSEPVDYYLEFKDDALTLHFMLPAKAPFKAKQTALEVFDPAYFIDFKFDEKEPIKLVGAPADCKMQFVRPNDGT